MKSFEVLGDPHLGRSFISGVPLHRRGDREEMVQRDFVDSLMNASKDYHIMMGDLFDKAVVSYDTIMFAATTYKKAAKLHPKTTFVLLQGNHDASRDLERVSAFDVFKMIVADCPNLFVITCPTEMDDFQFYPWHPVQTAEDMVIDSPAEIAFGHWDIDSFGGDDHNLIPTSKLQVKKAYTGHIHHPKEFNQDGIDVVVTGAMQPLAHGEGDLYVTKTLDEIRADPEALKDKCVRVYLQQGEIFDLELDCLQLQVHAYDEEDTGPSVAMGAFDINALFQTAFDTEGVPPAIQSLVLARFDEVRIR